MLLAVSAAALRRNQRGFSSRPPRRHHAPAAPPHRPPVPSPRPQPPPRPPPPLPPGVLRGVTDAMMKLAVAGTEQASAALGRAAADAAAQFWPSGVPRSLPPWVYARLHWAPEGTEQRGNEKERERERRGFERRLEHRQNRRHRVFFSSSSSSSTPSKPDPP